MTYRGAIIGFGNVAAQAHVPLWTADERFSIQAVVEPSARRAAAAREMLPGVAVYDDFATLLSEEKLDFIDICTPPALHEQHIVEASLAGLHVFCEKPLVPDPEAALRVQRAARTCGNVIFTVNNWKHAPIWEQTRRLIRDNRLGALRSISLSVLRPPASGGGATDWRRNPEMAGGGILLDHGWHHLYLVLWLTQQAPSAVSADMTYSVTPDSGLDEIVDLTLQFPEAEARIFLTWHASQRKNFGLIQGEHGTLAVKDDRLVLFPDGEAPQQFVFPEALSAGSQHPAWMRPVIDGFYRELTDRQARGENLREASLCAELIGLAYRSHRQQAAHVPVAVGAA